MLVIYWPQKSTYQRWLKCRYESTLKIKGYICLFKSHWPGELEWQLLVLLILKEHILTQTKYNTWLDFSSKAGLCSWLQTLSLSLRLSVSVPDSLRIRYEVQLMTLYASYIVMAVGDVKQQSVYKSHRIIDSKNLNPSMKHKLSQCQF